MLTPPAGLKVFVATNPVDFRKGADGLVALAKEVLRQDPLSGVALAFRAKRAGKRTFIVSDKRSLTDGVMRMNAAQLASFARRYTEISLLMSLTNPLPLR